MAVPLLCIKVAVLSRPRQQGNKQDLINDVVLCFCVGLCRTHNLAGIHHQAHPDDGLAVRGTSTLILRKGVLYAVPAARQRTL